MTRELMICGVLAAGLAAQEAASRTNHDASIDFNRDIRPILSQHCFACHGFDEQARKAELRLDRAEFAYASTADGITPIKPFDLEASEIWTRIQSTDLDDVMPPPSAHRDLSDAQKAKIRSWIEQGARYDEHWSFVPPVRATIPQGTPRMIDALVAAHLDASGLRFAEPAAPATLLRRVTIDLTGLPPSADEVAAFVSDRDPAAYEHAVDRLLTSPHFGERMAISWLDAARYADTNGFSIDGGRHLWLWRDYVIQALNTNKPYDRFLVEQIAGDLLPEKTDETLVATGFQRNSMSTHEGGTIPEENLVNYGADRVRTFGEAVLGLTLSCAQCHDHKFDPISQRDYYRLFAFLNQTSEPAHGGDGGVNAAPVATLKSVLVTGEEQALRARIAALEQQLAQPNASEVEHWEAGEARVRATRGVDFALHPVKLTNISTPNTGSGFEIEADRYARVTRPMGFVAFDVAMEFAQPSEQVTGLRIVMHADPAAPNAGWGWADAGRGEKRTFAVTNVSISAGSVASDQVNLYRMLELASATANCWSGSDRPEGVLETRGETAWVPDINHDGPVSLTVMFDEPLARDATNMTAQVNFGRWGDVTAKRMEFFLVTGHDNGSSLSPAIDAILSKDRGMRTAEESANVLVYFSAHAPATARTRVDLANARERLAARTEAHSTMVMDTAATPRETFLLNRGNYADPRDKVEAGTPEVLPPMPDDAPRNRLGLAQWVIDPRNPLTARVAVNRIWQVFFGAGLVRTTSDFGVQGDWPEHRALLDALAADFRDNGWNVKRLVRDIVTSDVYRQSSRTTPEMLERDPENRLLMRGPRFRLPAELIRDGALKAGGLLVNDIGGPSVNPYTPGDPWREVSHYGSSAATAQAFVQDHGEKLHRRSMYTYWKRTLPPPNMAIFDAPNRETCTFDRAATNTPLQALVMLNDTQFVEAARAFAERIIARDGSDAERLAWAFIETTSRVPDVRELDVISAALKRERARYTADDRAAHALVSHGESLRDRSLSVAEHAAWTQVAAVLLNLSEVVTRN